MITLQCNCVKCTANYTSPPYCISIRKKSFWTLDLVALAVAYQSHRLHGVKLQKRNQSGHRRVVQFQNLLRTVEGIILQNPTVTHWNVTLSIQNLTRLLSSVWQPRPVVSLYRQGIRDDELQTTASLDSQLADFLLGLESFWASSLVTISHIVFSCC